MILSPLPQGPRIVVSALFFYCEELAGDFVRRLRPQLDHAAAATGGSVHLRITLNYPDPSDSWDALLASFAPSLASGVTLDVVRGGYNRGFGRGHNQVFADLPSDIFVVINSDLFCESDDWITRAVDAFCDCRTGIVGARENASWLRADACGILVTDETQRHDFVDGSLLVVRSDAARALGLFSEDFQLFYFEDVDLCLRAQQAGLLVTPIPIPHRHLRSASSKRVPRYLVRGVLEENRERFFLKWRGFLERRSLSGSVLLDLRSTPARLLAAAIPTVLTIRQEHPSATVTVVHAADADTSLLAVTGCSLAPTPPDGPSDRLADWSAATALANLAPSVAFARVAGVDPVHSRNVRELRVAVRRMAAPMADSTARRAVFHFGQTPAKFEGKVPRAGIYSLAVERLGSLGFSVEGLVDEGQGEDIDWFLAGHPSRATPRNSLERARILLDADLVISGDDEILLLAQLLGVRSVGIFGATSALRSVFAWETTAVFLAPDLDCLACNHRFGLPTHNFCIRRDQACISAAHSQNLVRLLSDFLLNGRSDVDRALEIEGRLVLRPRRPSAELDLSGWPAE